MAEEEVFIVSDTTKTNPQSGETTRTIVTSDGGQAEWIRKPNGTWEAHGISN